MRKKLKVAVSFIVLPAIIFLLFGGFLFSIASFVGFM